MFATPLVSYSALICCTFPGEVSAQLVDTPLDDVCCDQTWPSEPIANTCIPATLLTDVIVPTSIETPPAAMSIGTAAAVGVAVWVAFSAGGPRTVAGVALGIARCSSDSNVKDGSCELSGNVRWIASATTT